MFDYKPLVDSSVGSYLLGAIHGDGHISKRSITISVGRHNPEYADMLTDLWLSLGFEPKRYVDKRELISIGVHNKILADDIRRFKGVDRWSFPVMPSSPSDYLAGLVDTDGFVGDPAKGSRSINITQKAGDKLHEIRPILDMLGFHHIAITRNNQHKVRGKIYPIDVVWWTARDDVVMFDRVIKLRHIDKARRLSDCVEFVHRLRKDDKRFQIVKFLKSTNGATLPEICAAFDFDRQDVIQALNALRRQSRVTRNDPPIDTLVWQWTDTNRKRTQ